MNSETTTLDTDMVPLGTRALRSILDHVQALGNAAETGYLEVKSTLDFKDKRSIAKSAKFLLGVANRSPNQAQKYLQGYAVMVIGADKDHSPGVSRGVGPHEIEGSLRVYLGSEFPTFDIELLPIDEDRDVMFIIASPRKDGQPMFQCHRDFNGDGRKDNLTNGAIYVRNLTETRPAKTSHIHSLIERTRGAGKKPINLEIEFFGGISRVQNTDKLIEQMFTYKHGKFMKVIAEKRPPRIKNLKTPQARHWQSSSSCCRTCRSASLLRNAIPSHQVASTKKEVPTARNKLLSWRCSSRDSFTCHNP